MLYDFCTVQINKLTFIIQAFQCQLSAVAGALFNLNTQCRTRFSFRMKRVYVQCNNIVLFVC